MSTTAQPKILAPDEEVKAALTLPREKTSYELKAEEVAKTVAGIEEITSDEQYVMVSELGVTVSRTLKDFENFINPIKAALYEPYKQTLDRIKSVADPLADSKRKLSRLIGAWDDKKERLRRAEEIRLREEAVRQVEERALQEASALSAEGRVEEANAVIEEAVNAPITSGVVVPRSTPQVAGVSKARKTWKAEVFDLKELVKAVAEGRADIDFLEPNQTVLNTRAREKEDKLSIPGVRAVSDASVSFRTK